MKRFGRILCAALALVFFLNISAMRVKAQEPAASSLEDSVFQDTIQTDMPQFFQTDYPDDLYGYGTVSSSGCSITSVAMVASYLTGHTYYPDELAAYFGGYGENNMQRLEYASDMLQLSWEKAENIHKVFAALEEGTSGFSLTVFAILKQVA